MSSKENRAKNLKKEFIKSGAMLLLAVVLLVTAVLAWFGDSEDVSIEPFLLSINSETDGIVLDEETIKDNIIILPAATDIDDDSISSEDLSKVIKVIPLQVISSDAEYVEISLMTEAGLHYYIDAEYNGKTYEVLDYATAIKAKTANDKPATFKYEEGDLDSTDNMKKRWVMIVFWADYEMHGETIRSDGEVNLNARMRFKPVDGITA